MERRYTEKNLRRILGAWPQAVSCDDGDLRVYHDMANNGINGSRGAQGWRERLLWPDYLWLPMVRPRSAACRTGRLGVVVKSPSPNRDDAVLGVVEGRRLEAFSGSFAVRTNRIECILETKAIKVDHVPKLEAYQPTIPWPSFLKRKLDRAFNLRHADEQLRDGKRLIAPDARGVAVVVNEGSPSLDPRMVSVYLAHAIHRLPNTDGIAYLSDRPNGRVCHVIVKAETDPLLEQFSEEFTAMLASVSWDSGEPTFRGGPYTDLTVRIEMDDRSRAIVANWATGWRAADDPTPIPQYSLKLTFVPREEFRSGLR